MVQCASSAASKLDGNSTVSTVAPASRSNLVASSITCRVAACACGQCGDGQKPMRGGRAKASALSASDPRIALARSATSATDRVKIPRLSNDPACTLTPCTGRIWCDGMKPTTPQYEAGRIVEPTVCVPIAAGTMKSATAAADPEEEPPGVCLMLCGFAVRPGVTAANSGVTVLPRMIAPARRSIATQAASADGTTPL